MSLSFANKVRETSTTTGTGTYDLAGAAAGYAGFVAAVGDAAVVTYRAQMGDDWEIGIGTITDAATDTLARTEVLETLVGGTYTKTGATAVDWGPGTKTIDLVGPAQMHTKDSGMMLTHPGQKIDGRYYTCGTDQQTGGLIEDGRQRFVPHYHARFAKLDLLMDIETAEADKSVDIGLYDWSNGEPGSLLESWTGISIAVAGLIEVSTTNIYKPGWYLLSYLSDATTAAKARGHSNGAVSAHTWATFLFGVDGTNMWATPSWVLTRNYSSGLVSPFSGSLTVNNAVTGVVVGRPSA